VVSQKTTIFSWVSNEKLEIKFYFLAWHGDGASLISWWKNVRGI